MKGRICKSCHFRITCLCQAFQTEKKNKQGKMRGNIDNPCSHVWFTEGCFKKAVSCDKHCIYRSQGKPEKWSHHNKDQKIF